MTVPSVVVRVPEAIAEESVGPIEAGVVLTAPSVARMLKESIDAKAIIGFLKGKVVAVTAPSKKKFIPPSKPKGMATRPRLYLWCLH